MRFFFAGDLTVLGVHAVTIKMAGLSREILRWMEGLDLKYPVKNVKRDFANGYLIAEILNRYYKSDITLHSFDLGQSASKKADNWMQIEKLCAKKGHPIDHSHVEGVLHNKDGAAIKIIERIYTALTNKPVLASSPAPSLSEANQMHTPPFARPTASKRIKDTLAHDVEVVKTDDQTVKLVATKRALAEHNRAVQLERTNEPERFAAIPRTQPLALLTGAAAAKAAAAGPINTSPKQPFARTGNNSSVVYKGTNRKVDNKSNAAVTGGAGAAGSVPLTFTTVNVKQIDTNFTAMANRSKSGADSLLYSPEKYAPHRIARAISFDLLRRSLT